MTLEEDTDSPRKSYVMTVVAVLALVVSSVSAGWQFYAWNNSKSKIIVEEIYVDDSAMALIIRNHGRGSATVGGFHFRSGDKIARVVLDKNWRNGSAKELNPYPLVVTSTSVLAPGGMEYITVFFDALSREFIRKELDPASVSPFLATGNGDVKFDLSADAIGKISQRMVELRAVSHSPGGG